MINLVFVGGWGEKKHGSLCIETCLVDNKKIKDILIFMSDRKGNLQHPGFSNLIN